MIKFDNNITNSTCAQPQKMNSSEQLLKNIKKVIKFIETNKPKLLYYAVSDIIEKGKIIHIYETKINPEYIIINREDFEKNEKLIMSITHLKPLSSYDSIKHYKEKLKEDLKWYI